jgi:hypothetical protein
MSVPVRLDFIPPPNADLVELRIYESPVQEGPFTLIETVTVIGDYPDFISTYTTAYATSSDYWFAIDWYDDKGGNLGISDSIQGNMQLLLGEIVARVMMRDSTINENIIYDEALAVLERFFPAGTDLRAIPIQDASEQEKSGLALLTQARCYIFDVSEGEEEYTVGLVSQKKRNSRSFDLIKMLLSRAESDLGLSFSAILQMAEVEVAGGVLTDATVDRSRLLIELQ